MIKQPWLYPKKAFMLMLSIKVIAIHNHLYASVLKTLYVLRKEQSMSQSLFAFTMQHRLIALAILFLAIVVAAFFLLHGAHAPLGPGSHPSLVETGSNTDW